MKTSYPEITFNKERSVPSEQLISLNAAMLKAMRLSTLREAYINRRVDEDFSSLSFDEKLYELLLTEWSKRRNTRYHRRLREANLPSQVTIETIISRRRDYKLSIDEINYFHNLDWCGHKIIVIAGASGLGKSDLGISILDSACRKNFKVRRYDYSLLMMKLSQAYESNNSDGYQSMLAGFFDFKLVMLDDAFLGAKRPNESIIIKDILDFTCKTGTGIVITAQLPKM